VSGQPGARGPRGSKKVIMVKKEKEVTCNHSVRCLFIIVEKQVQLVELVELVLAVLVDQV